MKKNKKIISTGLCVTMLFMSTPSVFCAASDSSNDSVAATATTNQHDMQKSQVTSSVQKTHSYIPKDTVLTVELTSELSSKKAKKGDLVPIKMSQNLIINDVVVIPEGATVKATITKVKKAGGFGRAGKLEFTIDRVKTINGIDVPLEYTAMKKEGNDSGAVVVGALVSLVGGIFMKGKNVSFPAGTTFEAKVSADTDLEVSLEGLADAMNPKTPHGVTITLE